ncbi:hypothetical protein GCM10009818_03400 [Nakamurella flavida]
MVSRGVEAVCPPDPAAALAAVVSVAWAPPELLHALSVSAAVRARAVAARALLRILIDSFLSTGIGIPGSSRLLREGCAGSAGCGNRANGDRAGGEGGAGA